MYFEVSRMKIVPAEPADFEAVRQITQATIRAVYPRYYPQGAVEFFLAHHCDAAIELDIREKSTKILKKLGGGGAELVLNKKGDNIYVLSGGNLQKIETKGGKATAIKYDITTPSKKSF